MAKSRYPVVALEDHPNPRAAYEAEIAVMRRMGSLLDKAPAGSRVEIDVGDGYRHVVRKREDGSTGNSIVRDVGDHRELVLADGVKYNSRSKV